MTPHPFYSRLASPIVPSSVPAIVRGVVSHNESIFRASANIFGVLFDEVLYGLKEGGGHLVGVNFSSEVNGLLDPKLFTHLTLKVRGIQIILQSSH